MNSRALPMNSWLNEAEVDAALKCFVATSKTVFGKQQNTLVVSQVMQEDGYCGIPRKAFVVAPGRESMRLVEKDDRRPPSTSLEVPSRSSTADSSCRAFAQIPGLAM